MPKCYLDNYTKEELEEIVNSSKTMEEVARKIGYSRYSGSSELAIAEKFDELGIPMLKTAHSEPKTDEDVFKKDSRVSQNCLRNHFKRIHPPEHCEVCGMEPIWQGKPITLILDHKDGDSSNNEKSNLRWVCPNCNQQLNTTCWRKYRVNKMKDKCRHKPAQPVKISAKEYMKDKEHDWHDRNREHGNKCKLCGKVITNNAEYCNDCAREMRNIQRMIELQDIVTRNELKEMIRKESFGEVAKHFGVSPKFNSVEATPLYGAG